MDPRIAKLHERMSGTREKAPGTIASYMEASRKFLAMLKGYKKPTRSDIDLYISKRRQAGISERTLLKEYHALHKLFQANDWVWPLTPDDAPSPQDETNPPKISQADAEKMIMAQGLYSKAERFYLAIATTWVVRREELAKVKKRDFDDNVIKIQTSKHGKPIKAPIPVVLRPVFAAYRPKQHAPVSLSAMFNRICQKAGVHRAHGAGWHTLRYLLDDLLIDVVEENHLKMSWLVDYQGWKPGEAARRLGGTTMMHRYRSTRRQQVGGDEAFTAIYAVHPFLKVWEKALAKKHAVPKS